MQNFPQNQKFPRLREFFFASLKPVFKKCPRPPGAQTEDSAPLPDKLSIAIFYLLINTEDGEQTIYTKAKKGC